MKGNFLKVHMMQFKLQFDAICFSISRSALAGSDFGPYCVAEIINFHIKLKDGALIAAKVRDIFLNIII